ncbi:MFS transporter [Chitinimonas sp.]|uniref:MFS transporter n=1 Tax=Chitinimonas sp. TaxID=1934313 RepID=UPI002F94BF2C
MPLALLALAVATFAIGTTEFVIVGLIPEIGRSLSVSVPTAGLLVSLYALAITLGTPIFSALTARLPRRGLILGLMAVFTLSNLAAALSPNYGSLLLSRLVMGVAHGVFFGAAATVATQLVPKHKSGSAVAVVMGGLTLAMVVGVPFGSWIGQLYSWRIPFLAVTAMGTVALLALLWQLPRQIAHTAPAGFLAQLSLLGNRRLLGLYAVTALGFGSSFVVFTFLAPLLTDVTGVSEAMVSTALMLFGGATVAGNLLGGRLADRLGARNAMLLVLLGLIVALGAIPATVHSAHAMLVNVLVWGAFAFAIPPIMLSAVVGVAEVEAPEAVGTASGFGIAAFNLGISGGAFLGARLLAGPGLLVTPYAAIALALAALLLVGTVMHTRPAVLRAA